MLNLFFFTYISFTSLKMLGCGNIDIWSLNCLNCSNALKTHYGFVLPYFSFLISGWLRLIHYLSPYRFHLSILPKCNVRVFFFHYSYSMWWSSLNHHLVIIITKVSSNWISLSWSGSVHSSSNHWEDTHNCHITFIVFIEFAKSSICLLLLQGASSN